MHTAYFYQASDKREKFIDIKWITDKLMNKVFKF